MNDVFYVNIEYVVHIRFVFEPSAAVRNNRAGIVVFADLVGLNFIVHTGRTNELGNNNALRAVDNECARFRHKRKIAHKDVLLFYFARRLIRKSYGNAQGCGIVYVAFLAFLNGILGCFAERIANEFDNEVACVVNYRRNFRKNVGNTLFEKPFIRFLLDLEKIGHFEDLVNLCKRLSRYASAKLSCFCSQYNHSISKFCEFLPFAAPLRRKHCIQKPEIRRFHSFSRPLITSNYDAVCNYITSPFPCQVYLAKFIK